MTKTILIVEDDPFIAMDLQDTFEDAGFSVLGPVASVNPGLDIISKTKPDVAMLDYNLGKETSIPIAHRLDAIKIPYVFLSGQVSSVVTANVETKHKVIMKPFNAEVLINYVNELVEAHAGGETILD
jgi:DNA-binding response OmpR family regulator